MNFLSQKVQSSSELFQRVSFGSSRQSLRKILMEEPDNTTHLEARALLLRIDVEKDDPDETVRIHEEAKELLPRITELRSFGGAVQLGITFVLCEDIESAKICFTFCEKWAKDTAEKLEALYGKAAVLHNEGNSRKALETLAPIRNSAPSDLSCLSWLLTGNCYRSLFENNEALSAYSQAQKQLAYVDTFYLKNWVFFGLGCIRARMGDVSSAKAWLEAAMAITHPRDFRRLHKLLSDEIERLDQKVEVFFDPDTGDLISNKGYLSLRRKPKLVEILKLLIENQPESVSKELLYETIWDVSYHPLKHDGLIYSHMQRLRSFLQKDKMLQDFILTTPEGYRLDPGVKATLRQGNTQGTVVLSSEVKHAS